MTRLVSQLAVAVAALSSSASALRQRAADELSSGAAHADAAASNLSSSAGGPAMLFARGGSTGDAMEIWRQGARIFEGAEKEYPFAKEHFMKEYLVEMRGGADSGDELVFVAGSPLCSVGRFTQRRLTCKPVTRPQLEDWMAPTAHLVPLSERGFGLEFEFVARDFKDVGDVAGFRTEVKQEMHTEVFDKIVQDLHTIFLNRENWPNGKPPSKEEILDKVRELAAEKAPGRVRQLVESGDLAERVATAINNAIKIPGVKRCFLDAISPSVGVGNGAAHEACSADTDCGIMEACLPRRKGGRAKLCKPRGKCAALRLRDDCPVPFSAWAWTSDISVAPLTPEQAKAVGGSRSEESLGVGFEIVSPVLSGAPGMRSAQEILALLRHVGVQSGPSQGLHVHVNAVGSAPGPRLSFRGIANVWAAWAKYQLVLDELLSPNRLEDDTSFYSRRLFLGQCRGERKFEADASCAENPCPCVRSAFSQMHGAIGSFEARGEGGGSDGEAVMSFCNAVLARPGLPEPCAERYPHPRYFQLNLASLGRFGTIEFRSHSATYDGERVARWVQLVVGFVDHFGASAQGSESMAGFFDEAAEKDLEQLAAAQKGAKTEELFEELRGVLDAETEEYYVSRRWEKQDKLCKPPGRGASFYTHFVGDEAAEAPSQADRLIAAAADVRLGFADDTEDSEDSEDEWAP